MLPRAIAICKKLLLEMVHTVVLIATFLIAVTIFGGMLWIGLNALRAHDFISTHTVAPLPCMGVSFILTGGAWMYTKRMDNLISRVTIRALSKIGITRP